MNETRTSVVMDLRANTDGATGEIPADRIAKANPKAAPHPGMRDDCGSSRRARFLERFESDLTGV